MDKKVDEKIIEFINEAKKREERDDITAGSIKIGKRYYEFENMEFFNNELKIFIPKDFVDMSMEDRKFKYPSESRPEVIKCNDDGSICITLNIIDSPLSEDKVEELKNGMKMIIRKTNPANVFYEDGLIEVNSKNIGFYEFKSSAIDADLYNLMFFAEFMGKTLMGTFSCKYEVYKEWRDIAYKMICTLKVIKEE
ncbi:hypothetical protein MT361_06660 [Clostridium butyricum]|nr:hypothetical protein [Clostridium butyricum]MDI9208233.1 hypothetical protein [Clostridium butyricum]